LAIIAHKWAESFAISSLLNNFIKNRSFCIVLFLIFAIMTPVGIGTGFILGQFSGLSPVFLPIVIATSAGTFLYLGTLHGLEQCVLVEKCCHLAEFTYVVIGFIIMALVAGWL
jgi:zinc transporter ZupT